MARSTTPTSVDRTGAAPSRERLAENSTKQWRKWLPIRYKIVFVHFLRFVRVSSGIGSSSISSLSSRVGGETRRRLGHKIGSVRGRCCFQHSIPRPKSRRGTSFKERGKEVGNACKIQMRHQEVEAMKNHQGLATVPVERSVIESKPRRYSHFAGVNGSRMMMLTSGHCERVALADSPPNHPILRFPALLEAGGRRRGPSDGVVG